MLLWIKILLNSNTSNINTSRYSFTHIIKPAKENCPCNVQWIKSSRETGAEIVLIAVQSLRARQGSLQSPKYPETGPRCPGRLLRPSSKRQRPSCVPNRPHQPLWACVDPALHVRVSSCKKAELPTRFLKGESWKLLYSSVRGDLHGANLRFIFTFKLFYFNQSFLRSPLKVDSWILTAKRNATF